MPGGLVTINIKRDMPTVEEARRRLETQLKELAGQGRAVVKVIHGYGSTGVGGKIRHGLATTFRRLQREGVIRSSIPGEQWKTTNQAARKLIAEFPLLKRDHDLGRAIRGHDCAARCRYAAETGQASWRHQADAAPSGSGSIDEVRSQGGL